MADSAQKIGIVVVAYNAASTLASVLDRIPGSFRSRIAQVLICDDFSSDATYDVGLSYQEQVADLPIKVIRNPRNLGYGGNQKVAYRLASELGLDIVVLLHGDGQYAPELLPEMVAPLERGECDAVMGSRMIVRGAARSGGMPLYKFVGNRILTAFENAMLRTRLSEFHSGYRAYRVKVLDSLGLDRNDDGFVFDTQIIIQLHDGGFRVVEIPIPTYYGDEICYVNGLQYAAEVTLEVARYRLGAMGLGSGPRCLAPGRFAQEPYEIKVAENSSHARVIDLLGDRPAGRVLDLGCSSGLLSERIRTFGHEIVGVDVAHHSGVEARVDTFVRADLDEGIPSEVGQGYDVVVAADVLEHVRDPARLLREARLCLTSYGVVVACVPNFGHWYPRLRTMLGLFDYDGRGILDEGHVRFFTRRSFERIVTAEGYMVLRRFTTGVPLERLGGRGGDLSSLLGRLDSWLAQLRPQLFAYQLIYELALRPGAERQISSASPSSGSA